MKKKIFGIMMWSLLILGFAGTVQAEEQDTEVEYKVNNSYTLVIPAAVDLEKNNEITIGTSEHNIEPTYQLSITLSSENNSISADGTISLERQRATSNTLSTKLTKKNDSSVLKKGDLLVKATDKSDNGTLETFIFSELTGEKKAGTYKTTITFLADVQQAIGGK